MHAHPAGLGESFPSHDQFLYSGGERMEGRGWRGEDGGERMAGSREGEKRKGGWDVGRGGREGDGGEEV